MGDIVHTSHIRIYQDQPPEDPTARLYNWETSYSTRQKSIQAQCSPPRLAAGRFRLRPKDRFYPSQPNMS